MTRSALPFLVLPALLALLGAGACQRSDEPLNEAKRMPKPPPPPDAALPTGLRIAVEIDGREAPPIDDQTLEGAKPDFEDGTRRAWKLTRLLARGEIRELAPGTMISVTGEGGITVELPIFSGRAEVPVLTMTRRGEVIAALVSPKDPFPAYHGHGGRLERPGDRLPRVGGVTRIRVSTKGALGPGLPPTPPTP